MMFTEKAVAAVDAAIAQYREQLYKIAGLIAMKEGNQEVTKEHITKAVEVLR